MALKDDHAQRARENEGVARNRLDTRRTADRPWFVTILFYAALQWVEAYLASKGFAGYLGDHQARASMVRTESHLKRIYGEYRLLLDRSFEARYRLRAFTDAELKDVETQYARLRAHIEPLL